MKARHIPDEAAILKAMASAPTAESRPVTQQVAPGRKVSAALGAPIRTQAKK